MENPKPHQRGSTLGLLGAFVVATWIFLAGLNVYSSKGASFVTSYTSLLPSIVPTMAPDTQPGPLNFNKLGCDVILPPGTQPIHFVLFKGKVRRPLLSCSVESAIQFVQPNQVIVVWTSDNTTLDDWFPWLHPYVEQQKLFMCKIDMGLIFQETPLQQWYESGRHTEGKYAAVSQNDAHRLGILWHLGGLYYDADIVAIHPALFKSNCNFYSSYGLDWDAWVANGAIRIEKRDPFLWRIMKFFVKNYDSEIWGQNGVEVFAQVLHRCLKRNEKGCRHKVVCPVLSWMTVHYLGFRETLNSTNTDEIDHWDVWTKSGMWGVHWHDTKWYGEEREDADKVAVAERKCFAENSLFHTIVKHSCPIFLQNNQAEVVC